MAGTEISVQEIRDSSCLVKVKPISAVEWVGEKTVPSVVAYGTCDRGQPYLGFMRLKKAPEKNNVVCQYFEFPHSGHGLQNDSAIQKQWM